MFYPEIAENKNSKAMIDTWFGYNHNYRIGAGEFYDMENLSSDNYPLLSPRKVRPELVHADNIRGILLTNNNLAYIAGEKLVYNKQEYDLSAYTGNDDHSIQQMVKFGAYILIFPMGVYFNVANRTEIGKIASSYVVPIGQTISYTVCDMEGNQLNTPDSSGHSRKVTESYTAPESPEGGDYWINTKDSEMGLYMWDKVKGMWSPIPTVYMKIHIPGAMLTSLFSRGDTVTMNTGIKNINSGSVVVAMGDDWIVVTGLIIQTGTSKLRMSFSETTDSSWQLHVERKIPILDYVCVNNNRVWGCHYGENADGTVTNEIYASKLGDFKNWYAYEGLSTDSYALSAGMDGAWTGCVSYKGYPTFFKENAIMRIFGNMPSQFQLITNNCRGVQNGSSRSIAIVNEYLVYKSASDVVVYDGSNPTSISSNLGRDRLYYDAVGGGCLNKYWISMEDAKGIPYFFVYDMQHHIWMKESPLTGAVSSLDSDNTEVKKDGKAPAVCFTATENGQIYAATNNRIYGIGATDNIIFVNQLVGEEYTEWFAETGEIGLDNTEYKKVNRITMRAFLPYHSEIQISISYDGRPFEDVKTLRGVNDISTQTVSIAPYRCDHYKLRFKGHGDCRIYTMATSFKAEGEKNAEYHI